MLEVVIVAGGEARRMGPWAPCPKPFLGIGPWDDKLQQGKGHSACYRALDNLSKVLRGTHIQKYEEVRYNVSVPRGPFDHDKHVPSGLPCGILRDRIKSPLLGPLESLQSKYKKDWGIDGVILHNGDDLIHEESVRLFIQAAPVPATVQMGPQPIILLATNRIQRAQFGLITAANTVDEKPILAQGWIGAGLLYLPPWAWKFACSHDIQNVSVLINTVYNELGRITQVVCSPHPWATIGNPEEYLAACQEGWLNA